MVDINSKEYTYANLNIIAIKRLIGKSELNDKEFSPSEIINIALDILRIMCEISYEDGIVDEYEWELFFKCGKSRDGILTLMSYLYRNGKGKNAILNEIFEKGDEADIKELLDKDGD